MINSGYHSVVIQDKKIIKKNYIRRQNTPKTYDMTTVVYIAKEYIENSDRFMNGKNKSSLIPPKRAIDIDTSL